MVLAPGRCSASRGKSSANSDIVEARFIEIIPGVRVVYEVEFVSDDPAYANTVTMTWEVTAVAGGSRVDITADNVPDGVSEEDHAAGLDSSLRNLADYLHACLPSPGAPPDVSKNSSDPGRNDNVSGRCCPSRFARISARSRAHSGIDRMPGDAGRSLAS